MFASARLFGVAITLLISTLVSSGVAQAQIGQDPKTNARHSRIVGLWDVEVTLANCTTGQPAGGFLALHKYELGGTGQVVPATNPAGLSEHSMIWSHVGGNDYVAAVKFYRFDPMGTFIGWVVINNEVSISEDATEYYGSGVSEIYNAAGTLLAAVCPSFIGTRFSGE